jgi:deoxyribonuclease-4
MAKMASTAVDLGCEAVQIFTRSPRGGKAKCLSPHDVAEMQSMFERHDIRPLVVHVPYFINLASADASKKAYSIEVLADDLSRAEVLGARYLVTHVGHREPGEPPESPDALSRVLDSIFQVLDRYQGSVKLLLENTAGQGRELGSRFETLGALLRNLPLDRVGACLDTCHALGAGYEISTPDGVSQILTEFDDSIGIENLGAIHLNDSRGALGSHVDRHQQIGKGSIGLDSFRALVRDPRLPRDLPGLLETPSDSLEDHRSNVKIVKNLRG